MSKSKLAILGGPKTIIIKSPHIIWPVITKSTKLAVEKQLEQTISIYNRSGIIEKFEDKFSNFHKKKYALLTSSGTSAIHTMYIGANIKPGDEVICPAYTFFATVTPLFSIGAKPVLCDSDKSGNIDPNKIEKLITKKTKGIVITHMWGIPCEMNKIVSICKKYNLLLFEDCSHAHGATYKNKLVGTFGDVAAWSLQGQKIITGGEGGILLTNDKEIYYKSLLFGQYNKRCKQEIPAKHPLYKYSTTGMGLKLRSHPLAIAIAYEQFQLLEKWLKQKRSFAKKMINKLESLPGIYPPKVDKTTNPSWYAFLFRYKKEELGNISIEIFFNAIQAEGCLEADRPGSTCPLNLLPLFQTPSKLFPNYSDKDFYKKGDFPVAENFFQNTIKLPVWPFSKDEKLIDKYLEAIIKVVKNYKDLL